MQAVCHAKQVLPALSCTITRACWIYSYLDVIDKKNGTPGLHQQIIDLQVSKTNENRAILVKYTRGF